MKKIFYLFILLNLFSQCKRENKSFDGPSLQDLNGVFGLLSPFKSDKNVVEFGKGETVGFSAEFTKICNWKIEINGTVSGAKKIIEGKSRIINASNANWKGSTTEFPVFKSEMCLAILKIEGVSDSFKLDINVLSIRKPSGFIVSNFENGLNSKWTTFIQSGANMDFKIHNDKFAVEGSNYLNMAGTVNWDWLIGLIDFPATAYGTSTNFGLSSISDDIFFNCLIYGVPNTNPSRILFQFKEDDNGNGNFDAANDDQYDKEIIVNWEGWKLVSFKYTDLIHLSNGVPATNNGNNKHNSNNINKISMLHLANPSMGFGSTKIDCIMFTEKGPLEL